MCDYVKVPLTPKMFLKHLSSLDTPEKNCNVPCRPKIISSSDFFTVKVEGNDVNQGICLYENLFTNTWDDVISVSFNSKKVCEDEIFGRQDKLQFSSREYKDYKYLRNIFGVMVRGTISKCSHHNCMNLIWQIIADKDKVWIIPVHYLGTNQYKDMATSISRKELIAKFKYLSPGR